MDLVPTFVPEYKVSTLYSGTARQNKGQVPYFKKKSICGGGGGEF